MRWIRQTSTLLAVAALALVLTGCIGPVWSTSELMGAENALTVAEEAGAEQKAPYEYHMAQELLRKAREEWGYSEFGQAQTYAEQAKDMADAARAKAETEPWVKPTSAIAQ